MKKIISKIRSKGWDKYDIAGWVIIALAFVANCIIIYKGTWAFIHSDGAASVVLAVEQWGQKKIYPIGWHYPTYIANFELCTIIIPFLKICKHWLDARACAVMVQTVLMLGLLAWGKKIKLYNKRWWIILLAMLLPISEPVSEHFYFQGSYMALIVWLMLSILLTFVCMASKRKVRLTGYIMLLIALVLGVGRGYTLVLVYVLPTLATCLFMVIYEKHRLNMHENKKKKYIIVFGIVALSTVLGLLYNKYLLGHVQLSTSATSTFSFRDYSMFDDGVLALFNAFMRLFGAADKQTDLVSLGGVNKALAFVYGLIMLGVIPFYLIKYFNKLKNDIQRFFVVFSFVSSFAVIYIFVFTGMTHSRYLLWIYLYTIIQLGIWLDNFEVFKFKYKSEIKVGVVVFALTLMLGVYIYYLSYDYQINPDQLGVNNNYIDHRVDYELIDYLEENNCTFGYAGYWQSTSYMVASDGKVKIAPLAYDWSGPYLWLSSDKWYQPRKGKCFMLLTEKQYEEVPDRYKKAAQKEDTFKTFKILYYKDVKTFQKLWQ